MYLHFAQVPIPVVTIFVRKTTLTNPKTTSPHSKFEKMKGRIKELDSRNKIIELVKVASIFTLPLFLYKICSLEAFKYSPSVALTNLLSVSSLILTMIFSNLFPSSISDKGSLWKALCVLLCINGICFSCLSDGYYSFYDSTQLPQQVIQGDSAKFSSLLDFLLHFSDRDPGSAAFF